MSKNTLRWKQGGLCEEMWWDGSDYQRVTVDKEVCFDTMFFTSESRSPDRRLRMQKLIRLSRNIFTDIDWGLWLVKVRRTSKDAGEFDSLIGQVHRDRFGDCKRIEEHMCHGQYLESCLSLAEQNAKINACVVRPASAAPG